ncbi:hypothetical protein ACMGDH_03870 [Sphingomonas sp. DT-207]|uniref:hypothetical protein n=1 Tax=Sphingomonas sp. DT-207 TaxID=3396167 RepID=UPI003F1D06FF
MKLFPIKAVALLSLGISTMALGTALQAQDYKPAQEPEGHCGSEARPCGPRHDDSSIETRGLAPNLEQGPASGAFRVSVDGQAETPTSADAQRATDVALGSDAIDVKVTALDGKPALSVVPAVPAVAPGQPLAFHLFTNYAAFIRKAELRIFGPEDSIEGTPLAIVNVTLGESAMWTPGDDQRQHRVVLRVYDAGGRYDETAPQSFLVTSAPKEREPDTRNGPLFENQRTTANIAVTGPEVTVAGTVKEPGSRVSAFGMRIPVDATGRFVSQQIVSGSTKDIVVRVAPASGEAREHRRAFNLPKGDHFLVAIADLTAGHRSFDDAKLELQGDAADPRKDYIDGRMAFYYKGRISQDWRITASADTGEHPLQDIFDSFLEKDSRSLLRRLDPDRHYPVYGDDSVTVEDAPTYGRFYVRAESENAEAMWGNFHTQLTGSELIRYQRGLYGALASWRNSESTAGGERRTEISGFAADPGTIGSREDFASTGGSVYYLRNQDLAQGSERLFVEVRDRDSGIVIERRELIAARDYDINYIQGRVLLREALPITADSDLFVRNSSLAGNPVWLVATYEYSPGLTRPDALTLGGRAQQWIGDHLRVGATGYHQGEDQASQDLYGADMLLRYKPGTYLRTEFARSNGAGNGVSYSSTGGYDFTQLTTVARQSDAYLVEGAADLDEIGVGAGRISAYWRSREQGYSGPGELTFGEGLDQFGGAADIEVAPGTKIQAKADLTDGTVTNRHAIEAGVRHEKADGWFGSVGVRSEKQEGQATNYTPYPADPGFQGTRTEVAASIGYRSTPAPETPTQDDQAQKRRIPWALSLFGQKTFDRSGGRRENDRIGVAGDAQITERLKLAAEVSDGDLGFGADARIDYAMGERGSIYLGYALAAENPDAFTSGRLGRLTAGTRRRFSSAVSVFAEGRYEHGSGPTGLTQAYGVDFTPIPGWTFGARYETGSLADALGRRIDREVIGGTVDYGGERLRWSSALEFRQDGSNIYGDRETWATRNQATFQATDALRLFAKANLSVSEGDASGGALDADYYELVAAAAFRPVDNDRLNLLAKYTYLYDLPSPGQVDQLGLNIDYAQRSHIVAVDGTYQLTPRFALGAKVAHRVGELRLSRDETAPWFSSAATFWAVRADYRVVARWDLLAEVRQLSIHEADDSRLGALVGVYRHLGNHVKVGVGYNFTDYSDDLTDLSYDERGFFVNLIGKF